MTGHFNGAHKHLNHFLLAYDKGIIKRCLPLVPSWISTAHLTLMTILWSIGIVFFGWLSVENINWLWGSSLLVFFQHVTDMLDGEVGRTRHSKLVKWGFYMDHFLDYIFLCAIVAGYSYILPGSYSPLVLLCLTILGGFMVNVFLDFSITNDFKISFYRFGPSEGRYLVIALNTALIFFGKGFFIKSFPYIVLVLFICLVTIIWHFQRTYRLIDMDNLE